MRIDILCQLCYNVIYNLIYNLKIILKGFEYIDMLNYGLKLKYDEQAKTYTITNERSVDVYDIELLIKKTFRYLPTRLVFKRVKKLKAGEIKKIKIHNSLITNMELLKCEYNDRRTHIRESIPKWLVFSLYIFAIFGLLYCYITNRGSFNDTILAILFITVIPCFILLLNAGARYDFWQEEKRNYSHLCMKQYNRL